MRRWCMGLGFRVCQLCQPGRARRLKPFLVHCFAPPQVPEAQPSSIHAAFLSSKNNGQGRPQPFLVHYFARSPNTGGIFRSFSPSPNLGPVAPAWPWHLENGISYCPNCFIDIIPPLNPTYRLVTPRQICDCGDDASVQGVLAYGSRPVREHHQHN